MSTQTHLQLNLPKAVILTLEIRVYVVDECAEETPIQSFSQKVSVMVGHFHGVASCDGIT